MTIRHRLVRHRSVRSLPLTLGVAASAALTPVVASAGTDDPTPTTLAADAAPAAAPAPAAPPAPLGPGATLDQFEAAITGLVGPTSDVMSSLAVLAPLGTGIPTPPDAFLAEFDLEVDADYGGQPVVIGSVTLVHTMPADAAAQLYVDAATAMGLEVWNDATAAASDGGTLREISYTDPSPIAALTMSEVSVYDGAGYDTVEIDFKSPATPEAVQAFAGWSTAVPMPPGGTITRGGFGFDGYTGQVFTDYSYPVADPAALRPQVEAGFPANGFTLDADMTGDDTNLYFDTDGSAGVDSLAIFLHNYEDDETTDAQISVSFELDTAPLPAPPADATAATSPELVTPTTGSATTGSATGGSATAATSAPAAVAMIPYEPAFPAGTTLQQLRERFAAIPASVPTDAFGAFAGITPLPAGVPTPPGAELVRYSVKFDDLGSDTDHGQWFSVLLRTTAPPADLVALYDRTLTGLGMTLDV